MSQYFITSFYKFVEISEPEKVQVQLEDFAKANGVKGLVILAEEGINSTLCIANEEQRDLVESYLKKLLGADILFKHSFCEAQAFRRFKVKIRPEIVTLGTPELTPESEQNHHLTPEEWNQVLKEEDVLCIDTRNWYETKIGKFKKAIDPDIEQFTDYPKYLEDNQVPKDKKILIYCTGGIRCEKGILEMNRMGYNNVYQLDGGILKYLEKFPNDEFEGECFVFDHRVAVDQNLQPTQKYDLCPHTGQPASKKITCVRCDSEALIAEEVVEDPIKSITCSKNCAYHWQLNPGRKGQHQKQEFDPKRMG